MRPSSVDTSEPAWTKRKMLSTNSSTSWCFSSRKYSATVNALRATRRRTPAGSSIWRGTVDLPAVVDALELLLGVERLADHVEHVAQGAVADRHGDAATGVAHRGSAPQPVGGLEADGPHARVGQLLGHLGRHRGGLTL